MPIKLMFITNQPSVAQEAESAGIDRIFVDLEILGKKERQGHLDTVISSHSIEDISVIRKVLKNSELLVRTNPIHNSIKEEIDEVISRGADILMLPMFKAAEEVELFISHVSGRAVTSLLLETPQALARIDEILAVRGIDEIHIGLNDLHLGMGLNFMFEPLSGGLVEYLIEKIKSKGIRCGFGGVARIGQGVLPADLILAEHYRLGSEMVILSRQFHGKANSLEELNKNIDLKTEVKKIRDAELFLNKAGAAFLSEKHREVQDIVKDIVSKMHLNIKQ